MLWVCVKVRSYIADHETTRDNECPVQVPGDYVEKGQENEIQQRYHFRRGEQKPIISLLLYSGIVKRKLDCNLDFSVYGETTKWNTTRSRLLRFSRPTGLWCGSQLNFLFRYRYRYQMVRSLTRSTEEKKLFGYWKAVSWINSPI